MITLGSRAQLGIGIAVQLHDQFSGAAGRVAQSMKNMRNQVHAQATAAMRDYRNNSVAIATGAAAMTYGMYQAAQQGADFQHKINQVFIVGEGKIGKSRQQLTAYAEDMTRHFTKTPTEIAGAMFENVKAGITKGLEDITRYQIAVATATDEALEGEQGVAAGLLQIMNSMNIAAQGSYNVAGKTVNGFARISNAVTAAANASMASVYSINESMQYFSNTAHSVNMTLEQSLALVAKLAQSGIRGSSAGTALNNAVTQLTNALGPFMSPKKAKAWATLGIDPSMIEAMVNTGRVYESLATIDAAASKLNLTSRLSTLNALFNVRGQKGLISAFLDSDPDKTLEALKRDIIKGVQSDVAMQQSKAMMSDMASEMVKTSNSFLRAKNAFLRAAEPMMKVLLRLGTRFMNIASAFLDTGIGRVVTSIAVVTAPLVGILFALRAAALTATLALRSLSVGSGAAGFSGLMQAGLGMLGSGMLGRYGVARNAAGRMYVAKGQTVNIGGKIYRGGQILPAGFQAGAAMMGSRAASMNLGKLGSWTAKIAGFGLKWLPVIGWIWTAVEVLNAIFGVMDKERKETSEKSRYEEDLLRALFGGRMTTPESMQTLNPGAYKGLHNPPITNINLNIDGKKAMEQTIQAVAEKQVDHNINTNLWY